MNDDTAGLRLRSSAGRWTIAAAVLGSASLLTVGSCDRPAGTTATVVDSAGVAIVTISGHPEALSWMADTVRVFGGDASGPATFYRVRPSLVDVDVQGRIFILEPAENRATVFDSTGRALGSIGNEGEGPGEMTWPLSVSASKDGHVYVHDGRGRLLRLTIGEEAGTDTPYRYSVVNMYFRHVEWTPSGILLWARQPYTGNDTRMDRLLLVEGSDTTTVISGRPAHSTTAYYPDCGITFTLHQPLAPRIRWSQWGDRFAVSILGGFRVDVFDDGQLAISLRSAAGNAGKSLSRSEAVALLEARGYRGPCDTPAGEVVEKHGYYTRPQVVKGLAVAPTGHLWVEMAGEEGDRIRIFAPDGRPMGVLPEGFPMPLTFLPDSRPLIQVVDTFDVERLGVVAILP